MKWCCTLILLFVLFIGCKSEEQPSTEPTNEPEKSESVAKTPEKLPADTYQTELPPGCTDLATCKLECPPGSVVQRFTADHGEFACMVGNEKYGPYVGFSEKGKIEFHGHQYRDRPHGRSVRYDDQGRIANVWHERYGVICGDVKEFGPDGKGRVAGEFRGVPEYIVMNRLRHCVSHPEGARCPPCVEDGVMKTDDGTWVIERTYAKGVPNGPETGWQNDVKLMEMSNHDGRSHGLFTWFHDSGGSTKYQGRFNHGAVCGTWRCYNPDGTPSNCAEIEGIPMEMVSSKRCKIAGSGELHCPACGSEPI